MEEIIAAIFVLLFFIIILGTCAILLLYRLSALEEKFEILSNFYSITMQDIKSNLIMLEEYLKIKKIKQSEKTYYIKGDK